MEKEAGRIIRFIHPRQTTAVSLTGSQCQLDCAHCGGHYLKHMTSLADLCNGNQTPSGTSWLVSGGCGVDGSISYGEHLPLLKGLKGERKFNIHVGLIREEDIAGVAAIADQISFDFVGDEDTIREVFGINRAVDEYVKCYQNLRRYAPVTPHICLGLHGGKLRGEWRALELLLDLGADRLTLIIFTPTSGTRYANCSPPPIMEVNGFFTYARQAFPNIPIHLGCLRPGGRYRSEVDRLAVEAGLDSIVNPAPTAVALATTLGLKVTWGEECCGL
jgi:uncharacterized radical SAM superfamily protein